MFVKSTKLWPDAMANALSMQAPNADCRSGKSTKQSFHRAHKFRRSFSAFSFMPLFVQLCCRFSLFLCYVRNWQGDQFYENMYTMCRIEPWLNVMLESTHARTYNKNVTATKQQQQKYSQWLLLFIIYISHMCKYDTLVDILYCF